MKFTDPTGKDWYQQNDNDGKIIKDGAVQWRKGSGAVKGYADIGSSYTQNAGFGISVTYNQDKAVSMTETVLNKKDFSSQMTGKFKADGIHFEKKTPENKEGDCFYNVGKMVAATGATMSLGSEKSSDIVTKINKEVDQGHSIGVHVNGTHWVAISSRNTDLTTGQVTSFGFADPSGWTAGGQNPGVGTSFSIFNNVLKGSPAYNLSTIYTVTGVEENKP